MSCDWLFVDGSSLIFRAFYGVPKTVKSPDGRLINAARGFFETLTRLLSTRQPNHIAVASDADWRPDWRVALIPGYKAQRVAEPIPPALIPQMPIIDAFLAAIGIDELGLAGYEAEDVIATWTAKATGTVEIVSGDRDLFALIDDPRVKVLYPEKGGLAVVDEAEVTRRYGIPGRRYADFAMLRGDPSDGLPGLKGVGAVAAASMIRQHGDVAAILEAGRLSEHDHDYLTRALKVVPPVPDLPVELPQGRRERYPAEPQALNTLMAEYGLQAASSRLVEALNERLRES
ncbi:MAG TPA: flap endonuclease [Candidatus Dormibacteraeota bacterium]|nr:flap endonuclease [Candidatus Dormibacteraeota bacterium]